MFNYILIFILIVLSAMFSGSEIAFASCKETKLKKDEKAANAFYIYNNYERALISILVGNNLVNISASSCATVIAIALLGDKGAPIASLIMTVLIVTFGEIVPKVIASKAPEDFAKLVSYPIRLVMNIFYPVVKLVNWLLKHLSKLWKDSISVDEVTENDLETIIDTVEEEGVIDEDTADLLQNAMDFDDVLAYEIITHRMDVDGIDIEDDLANIKEILCSTIYSRLPVYEGSLDNPLGFVVVDECLKEIIKGDFDLNKMIRKAIFVYKTTKLDDVLLLMRKKKCHLVFVSDEYGGTMGIVTMEDVLEQIVGEIWDEKDIIDEEFEKIRKDVYDVQGDMRIEDVFEELEFEDEQFSSDNATVGGWCIEMLEKYPKVGDSFDYKNLHITIKKMSKKRVVEIRIKVN